MRRIFRPLAVVFRERSFRRTGELEYVTKPRYDDLCSSSCPVALHHFQTPRSLHPPDNPRCCFALETANRFAHSVADCGPSSRVDTDPDPRSAIDVHSILNNRRESSVEEIDRVLQKCKLVLTDELVMDVLNRNRSDWKPAYILFQLLSSVGVRSPGPGVCCEILDILGRMRRFDEMIQVFVEMSQRDGLLNGKTFEVLLRRFAAAHKVDEAINVYKRRKEFGVEDELEAFQGLVKWLCRYKHVVVAEGLFVSKRKELGCDIKTMNIILNGWCVLGNVHEAERFWKDILESKVKPDSFTYGTFINALTKKGKLGKAMELLRAMWDNGQNPDVVVCNTAIDALCFKKRIPEALALYNEMCEKGYSPNTSSYSSLIKHFCRIRRMDEVYKILDTMEQKGGDCRPSHRTYGYLLKASRNPEEINSLLARMEKNGIKMTGDLYNMIFKLYMVWNYLDKARVLWDEMERSGLGPDQRTYTIMIHELYVKGRTKEALRYYDDMILKGMVPEPRTEILVETMKSEPEKGEALEHKGKQSARKKGKRHKSNRVRSKKTK